MYTFSFGVPFLFIPRLQVFKHMMIIRYIVQINLCKAKQSITALRAAGRRARAWRPRDPRRLRELAVACTGGRAPPREPHLQNRGRRKCAAAFARGGRGWVHDELGVRGAAVSSAQSDRKRVHAVARSNLDERGRERGAVLEHEELGRWAPDERGGGPAERSVPDW
jgi:hypothetical protein